MSPRRRSSERPNEEQGRFATGVVASKFGLEVDRDSTDWYDAVLESTGTKYEVKSTHEELESGAPGRFRLWEDQHRSLVASASSGQGTAWYAFVLLSRRGEVVDVQRRRPSTVTRLVGGEWNRAQHAERDSRQHKLPWHEVFP